MISINRIFHPVGQGLFCTEELILKNEKKVVVYDCGSFQKKKVIAEVNSFFPKKDEKSVIDILFISHFDQDHINGIEELKENCVIKNVVIPKLSTIQISYYLCKDIENIILLKNLLLTPEEFFEGSTIVWIEDSSITSNDMKEEEKNMVLEDDFCCYELKDGKLECYKKKNGVGVVIKIDGIWMYKPFNYSTDTSMDPFKYELERENLDLRKMHKIDYVWTHRKILKSIYAKMKGKINFNSMLLYSDVLGNIDKVISYNDGSYSPCTDSDICSHFDCKKEVGCLYLGDSSPKSLEQFVNRNQYIKKHINILQVSHHGAVNDTRKENIVDLLSLNIAVLSYGTDNNYGHPSAVVIDILNHSNKIIKHVTEKRDSLFFQNIKLE